MMKVGRRLYRAYWKVARTRKPLRQVPEIDGARFLFIGGLHRSGTSIVHRLLREHPHTSGFDNTPAPEDEGQHLQSVFPPARPFGGPGRFAFAKEAHLFETSAYVSDVHRTQLLREWGAYYDLSKMVLLEKSPPNLIRGRFLQAMFPGARFLFIVRHPIAVSCATQKWSKTSVLELLFHWCTAHRLMLDDLQYLDRAMVVRYEDLAAKPLFHLNEICQFAGLPSFVPREGISDHNERYFSQWKRDRNIMPLRPEDLLNVDRGPIATFGYWLSEPFITPWTSSAVHSGAADAVRPGGADGGDNGSKDGR